MIKELVKVKYADRIGLNKTLKVYVWDGGSVSLSYDDDKKPYFVLSNRNRKNLIKALQKKK